MRSWRLLAALLFALLSVIPVSADEPLSVPAGAALDHLTLPPWKTVDLAPFYPAGMERPYPDDVEGQTLEQFLLKFEKVTDIALRLDRDKLLEAGVNLNVPIKKRVAGLPSSIVLDRVLEDISGKDLRWIERDGVYWVTTPEEATRNGRVSTLEIGPLLDGGYAAETLKRLAMQLSSGPWRETDGDGGKVRVLGDRMTVMQSQEGVREVQVILTALASKEPVLAYSRTPADERVRDALAKPVTVEFTDVPLATVIDKLGRQVGIITELTQEALDSVGGDVQFSLNVRNKSLKEALDEVLRHDRCSGLKSMIRNGVLIVTSFEKASPIHEGRIYDIPEVAERGDTQALITLIQEMTSGPWREIDGDGGTIESPRPRTLIIHQVESGFEEIEPLIAAHCGGKVRPKSAGKVIEVKRHRVQAQMAEDLIPLIPRFVCPDEWKDFPDGSSPTIERVSIEDEVILVIRQTQSVHDGIEKFIRDLLTTPAFQVQEQLQPPPPGGAGFF
jgi:hypothetical protein